MPGFIFWSRARIFFSFLLLTALNKAFEANVEKILSRKSESEPRDLISQEQELELEPTEKDRYSNTAAQTIYIY